MTRWRKLRYDETELIDMLTWLMPDEDPYRVRRLVQFRSPVLLLLGQPRSRIDALHWFAYSTASRLMGRR